MFVLLESRKKIARYRDSRSVTIRIPSQQGNHEGSFPREGNNPGPRTRTLQRLPVIYRSAAPLPFHLVPKEIFDLAGSVSMLEIHDRRGRFNFPDLAPTTPTSILESISTVHRVSNITIQNQWKRLHGKLKKESIDVDTAWRYSSITISTTVFSFFLNRLRLNRILRNISREKTTFQVLFVIIDIRLVVLSFIIINCLTINTIDKVSRRYFFVLRSTTVAILKCLHFGFIL